MFFILFILFSATMGALLMWLVIRLWRLLGFAAFAWATYFSVAIAHSGQGALVFGAIAALFFFLSVKPVIDWVREVRREGDEEYYAERYNGDPLDETGWLTNPDESWKD